jgi:diguanylate cyclase (GGDEF)-like protein
MPQSILLVDDDAGQIQVLGRILSALGDLRFATNGEVALALAREAPPDVILLDSEMPGMSGFELCEQLKADPVLADVPVIFVTSHCEPAFELAGFEIGAADFIAKPVNAPVVVARVQMQLRLKRMADELRRIATIDVLTDVANRRRFDESLAREWGRARREGSALSLMMIDVDHFKAYNDRYGHPAGDACLRSLAKALASTCLRPADLVARYGGEEFVLLLPQTPRRGAEHMVRSVLAAIEELGIAHDASPTARHVTVSIGASCYDEDSACWVPSLSKSRFMADLTAHCSAVDLLQAADRALYVAKHAGRAQARLLDLTDVDHPETAVAIAKWARPTKVTERREHRMA